MYVYKNKSKYFKIQTTGAAQLWCMHLKLKETAICVHRRHRNSGLFTACTEGTSKITGYIYVYVYMKY